MDPDTHISPIPALQKADMKRVRRERFAPDPPPSSPKNEQARAPDHSSAKMMREVTNRLPLSASMNQFVDWMNRQGIDRQASGAIGPSSLLNFLVGWCQAQNQALTSLFQSEFPETSSDDFVEIAIRLLESNQAARNVLGFPYISAPCEEVMLEAKTIASDLSREVIEPQDILASLLVRAGAEEDPDAYLGIEPGRQKRLQDAFLYLAQKGEYGGTWPDWQQVFSPSATGPDLTETRSPLSGLRPTRPPAVSREPQEKEALPPPATTPDLTEKKTRPSVIRPAGAPAMGREPQAGELCLNVGVTAAALAGIIKVGTDGDFCMALKGQWGRGKTTLMAEVEKLLTQNNGDYAVVKFNVWKYPQRPEVWVYLYQRILETAHRCGSFSKARLTFHQNLEAVGWWPLFAALISFQIALLPIATLTNWGIQTFGAVAILFGIIFTTNSAKFLRVIRLRYFVPTDHTGHLGLQASIGKDLKHLLKVWVRLPGQAGPNKLYTALLSLFATTLSWTIFYRLAGHHPIDFANRGLSAYGGWWIAGAVLGGIVPWLLRLPPKGPKRTLLIVDDLDRCSADSMITVIESIRLMLDDPQINQRMQTVILFDDSLLNEALEAKFAAKEDVAQGDKEEKTVTDAKIRRLIRGQLDKYFLLEFNLPPLTKEETMEYLETLLEWNQREVQTRERAEKAKREQQEIESLKARLNEDESSIKNPKWVEYAEVRGINLKTGHPNAIIPGEKAPPEYVAPTPAELAEIRQTKKQAQEELERLTKGRQSPPSPSVQKLDDVILKQFTFTEDERNEIRKVFTDLPPTSASPRSIRSFLLRCQLAQFILSTARQEFEGSKLVRAVACRYFEIGSQIPDGAEKSVAYHVV